MLTGIFDAGPLITACKFESQGKLVIDHLLSGCHIAIAPRVEEVAVLGAGYPDGVAAGERIAQGTLQVVPVVTRKRAQHLADYALGDGERESIELCGQVEGAKALVTDDYLAFVVATRLGLKAWMLPDLVLELTERGSLAVEAAKAILEAIRPRYRVGVIEHSLVRLQEAQKDAESGGAGRGGDPASGGTSQGGGGG
jgi:predicted nucleic acid-binding protein